MLERIVPVTIKPGSACLAGGVVSGLRACRLKDARRLLPSELGSATVLALLRLLIIGRRVPTRFHPCMCSCTVSSRLSSASLSFTVSDQAHCIKFNDRFARCHCGSLGHAIHDGTNGW